MRVPDAQRAGVLWNKRRHYGRWIRREDIEPWYDTMGDRSGGVGNFAQPGLSPPLPPCLRTLEGGTSANDNHAEGYEHHHEH